MDAATSQGLVTAGNSKEREKKLERLLTESAALRETAEKLAAEVARLREEIERAQAGAKERRKRQRRKGK